MGQLEHQPVLGNPIHPGADLADHVAGEEQAVVADPQRPEGSATDGRRLRRIGRWFSRRRYGFRGTGSGLLDRLVRPVVTGALQVDAVLTLDRAPVPLLLLPVPALPVAALVCCPIPGPGRAGRTRFARFGGVVGVGLTRLTHRPVLSIAGQPTLSRRSADVPRCDSSHHEPRTPAQRSFVARLTRLAR